MLVFTVTLTTCRVVLPFSVLSDVKVLLIVTTVTAPFSVVVVVTVVVLVMVTSPFTPFKTALSMMMPVLLVALPHMLYCEQLQEQDELRTLSS